MLADEETKAVVADEGTTAVVAVVADEETAWTATECRRNTKSQVTCASAVVSSIVL